MWKTHEATLMNHSFLRERDIYISIYIYVVFEINYRYAKLIEYLRMPMGLLHIPLAQICAV